MQNKVKYQNLANKIDLRLTFVLASLSSSMEQSENIKLRNDLEYVEDSELNLASNRMIVVRRSLANFFLKENGIDFIFPKSRHVCFIVSDNIAVACRAILNNAGIASIQGILMKGKVYHYDDYRSLAMIPNMSLATLEDLTLRTQAYAFFYLTSFVKCYMNMIEMLIKLKEQ